MLLYVYVHADSFPRLLAGVHLYSCFATPHSRHLASLHGPLRVPPLSSDSQEFVIRIKSLLRSADGLGRLARVIAVRALELLDEGDVPLLGVGLRRAGVDLLLPGLLLGLALCSARVC